MARLKISFLFKFLSCIIVNKAILKKANAVSLKNMYVQKQKFFLF